MRHHTLGTYRDGYKEVEYCKVCGAEGLLLLEDCKQKIIDPVEKPLDEKEQTFK